MVATMVAATRREYDQNVRVNGFASFMLASLMNERQLDDIRLVKGLHVDTYRNRANNRLCGRIR